MIYLRDATACYLIFTLAATGLAKLRRWRTVAVVLARDAVFPTAFTPVVVFSVSLTELLLAAFLSIRFELTYTAAAVLALFVAFGGYRIAAAHSSNALTCGCSGAERANELTKPTLIATMLATSCQVMAALILIFTSGLSRSSLSASAWMAALAIPLGAFIVGQVRSRLGNSSASYLDRLGSRRISRRRHEAMSGST